MTDNNLIPLPVLIKQWRNDWFENNRVEYSEYSYIATQAAQWGADQELEACCEWLQHDYPNIGANALRTARRPKPPSLKEQALQKLAWVHKHLDMPLHNHCNAIHTIRRALESIND